MAYKTTNENSLIAENELEKEIKETGKIPPHEGHSEEQIEEHVKEVHAQEAAEQDVFSRLLNENMGDHAQLAYFDAAHLDLPKIIIDDGLHVYANGKSMEEAGLFTEHHHEIVHKDSHEPVALNMSITSFVFFELLAAFIVLIVFKIAASKYKKNMRGPKGFQNLMESLFIYVRDEVVTPNVGGVRIASYLMPYFVALFFFILLMNLFGLIPGGHSPTSNISVTAGLAVTAFIVINITAMKEAGIGAWFKHLLGGAPWWLFPIMVPIEIISMFVKPFALTIRLFANMTAGHVVILSLIGLIFFFKTVLVSPVSVGFALFIYTLELLVAFIQAYIFTILTAVFVGLAIGDHAHEEHEEGIEH